MKEKNQFFISYMSTVEFVSKKREEVSKKTGEKYWLRDLSVSVHDANPKYPVNLVFNLMGKKVTLADGLSKGMDVLVKFTINSKAYTTAEGETKYFLSLNLIDVEYEGKQQAGTTGKSSTAHLDIDDSEGDSLPF
jgi:hypothetical protein